MSCWKSLATVYPRYLRVSRFARTRAASLSGERVTEHRGMRSRAFASRLLAAGWILLLWGHSGPLAGVVLAEQADSSRNSFALVDPLVPREKLVVGGGRNDVRSVDSPSFSDAREASRWVSPSMLVLGVRVGEESRAYPERVLDYHQVVNDSLSGEPVLISWDPVSGVPLAFSRRQGDRVLQFGVSGLLHQSHSLLYDRETESLWSPLMGVAVAGPLKGSKLDRIPLVKQPARDWYAENPETTFLKRPFPEQIDYRRSPFIAHWSSPDVPFPVDARDERFHPKEMVLGVSTGDLHRAYLGSVLTEMGGRVVDVLGDQKIRIQYDTESASFRWEASPGLEATEAYWFAWKAHRPGTEIWDGAIESSKPAEKSSSVP